MMKKLFDGLKVAIDVDVLGTIVKTNSPYVQGSRVTLLEMDFSQLLANEQLLSQIGEPGSIEEAKQMLKDVKGFKVNLDREVTIESVVNHRDTTAQRRTELVGGNPKKPRASLCLRDPNERAVPDLSGVACG